MAKKMTKEEQGVANGKADMDFTTDLIKSLNKDIGNRIAYNLTTDIAPTNIANWVSTGSRLLDYIISNRKNGGLPEGRIIEIFGPPSIGKSHIALQIAKCTQKNGGIVVYIDTENATMIENLHNLGIDIKKKFVFIETSCTEEVFDVAEKTILKAKGMNKDVPVTIIWDSVAATSPRAELDGEYDQNTIGLQARSISKGMRKITGLIGAERVTFIILNQTRTKIGVMYGDPMTTPGGMAIPFHASVRLKLGSGAHIKRGGDKGDVIGINVSAKTIKNKVSPPFRSCEFEIHFGVGIKEHQQLFDMLKTYCNENDGHAVINGNKVCVEGEGTWKTFWVEDNSGKRIIEKKFTKGNFDKVIDDPAYTSYIEDLIDLAMVKKFNNSEPDIDPESYEEIKAIAGEVTEMDDETLAELSS